MRTRGRTAEQKLAAIASRSHGVVTRQELLRAGISRSGIRRRIAKGTLIVEYRGVYRVGHRAPSIEAYYLAAVRACGEGAVLSGRPAAYVLGLLRGRAPAPEATAPTQRRVAGVRTRRSRSYDRRDVTTLRAIPITTVARTLVDLAADSSLDELARACHEAGVRYRTTPRQVEEVLARRPSSPGARKLRRVTGGEALVTLSKLERGFLARLKEEGFPLPETNKLASGRRVDCRWPKHRLTVELNSYTFHNSLHAWNRDQRRAREARARRDRYRRYVYYDVFVDPRDMLAELSELLPRGRPA